MAEFRAVWNDKGIEVGGVRYTLRGSVMRTKQERDINARLIALAKAAQAHLCDAQTDKNKPP